jgi:hypothetical protein
MKEKRRRDGDGRVEGAKTGAYLSGGMDFRQLG